MAALAIFIVCLVLPLQQGSSFTSVLRTPRQVSSLGIATSRSPIIIPQSTPNSSPISTLESIELLPWLQSIATARDLSYMPMLKTQLDVIKMMGMQPSHVDEKFVYKTSSLKPARIGNMAFHNSKFRNVRLTYFDAGDSVQVFNSLWYPSFEYDIPLLGIDLISLGKNRVLTVIDFQPLHPTEEYSSKYIDHLKSIRDKYPDLQGTLSGKFYDDTSFFSKQMLFGRFPDESKLTSTVSPAFSEYLHAYVKLMDNAAPDFSVESMNVVKQRQEAYDIYSAAKDPAVGLFDAYFGKEWSKSFVHDFLFELSFDTESPPVHKFSLNPDPNAPRVH